jgi:hypothetical protein
MKQYLLSVHYVADQAAPDAATIEKMLADVEALNQQMQQEGVWVFAGGLEQPHVATVVREQDGEILTTDGPFAEAKEHLGGFWVIKAAGDDEALAWAHRATRACRGPVEVRPFQDEAEE